MACEKHCIYTGYFNISTQLEIPTQTRGIIKPLCKRKRGVRERYYPSVRTENKGGISAD